MNTSKHPDLGTALEQSRSGLRDNHRRSLTRLLFLATGSALVVFACLQFFNGYPWVALVELLASGLLFYGVFCLKTTAHLQQWIYAYLVSRSQWLRRWFRMSQNRASLSVLPTAS